MSYGISVNNYTNELLISDTYPTPQFLGKLTPSYLSSSSVSGNNVHEYAYSGLTNPVSGKPLMFFVTLPETSSINYYAFDPAIAFAVGSSVSYGMKVITTAAVGTYSLPEVYVFTLTDHKAATGFGVQVFNASGTVTFDSRNTPLGLLFLSNAGTSTQPIYPYGTESTIVLAGLSTFSKVAYLLPFYSAISHGRFGNTYDYVGGVRATDGGVLYMLACAVTDDGTPDSAPSYRYDYTPNVSPTTYAAIDASKYD